MDQSPNKLFRKSAVDAQNVMNGRVRIAPPASWAATNILLILIVVSIVVFASLASYARTVEVTGSLETTIASPRITAPARGQVSLIKKQGDNVDKGDLVATTALETISGSGDPAQQRREILDSEIESAQLKAQSANNVGEAQAQASMAQAKAARIRISALSEQLQQAQRQTTVAQDDLDRARSIAAKGFLSRRDLESRESAVSQRKQEEARIREDIAIANGDALSSEALAMQARSQAGLTAREAMESAARAKRDMISDESVSETRHKAAISGYLASVPVRDGQMVEAGQLLAIIVPHEAKMVAVLKIPADVMTSLKPGQEVGISVDAYPYETFGMIKSQISTVSQVPVESDKGPAYIVEVQMPSSMIVYGEKVRLLPGMTLTARIRTRERSLLQWLLEPLYAVGRR